MEWFRSFFDSDYVSLLSDQTRARTKPEIAAVVEALDLPRGARVLDVGCGFGRHSLGLARRGYRVVGVDLSPAMLAEARRRVDGLPATFLRGDMRRMRFRAEFDGVVSLFTSFGYFSPRENEAVLRRMARALRSGGRLLIDAIDRAYLDAQALPRHWEQTGERYVLEETDYDRSTGRVRSSWLLLTPGRKRARWRRSDLYAYSLMQWKAMFRRAGLRLLRAYGGYNLKPPQSGVTRRLIVVGTAI